MDKENINKILKSAIKQLNKIISFDLKDDIELENALTMAKDIKDKASLLTTIVHIPKKDDTITIYLTDYEGTKVPVEIPANTEYVSGTIRSGDMVMEYPFYKDSNYSRMMDFDVYTWRVEREDFKRKLGKNSHYSF